MEFIWKIGGEAGMGIMASGLTMCKAFTRGGLSAVGYPEYPSLVRGGENTFQIRVGEDVHAPLKKNHLVVCLNRPTVDFHREQVYENGAIIYDSSATKIEPGEFGADKALLDVPLLRLATDNGGDVIMRNTVALGASIAFMGYDISLLEQVLAETFARKGQQVVDQNVKIARAGHDYMLHNYKAQMESFKFKIRKKSDSRKMVISGNEAIALGAAAGGLKLFSAYPMTPSSSIMHYIAQKELDFDIIMKQTEDEIAAVQYAIGANFAGVRAATATSGGGFSLMAESLGLSALSETPVTIFLAQRPGPSTCLPTWTEQADLKFALNASQGEFLRIVLAPGDMHECFHYAARALNLADKYQLPVILLSDKYLSETFFSCAKFDMGVKIERGKMITKDMKPLPLNARYKRYLITKDGISPRPIPGVIGGEHVSGSYEHFENGYSAETFSVRAAMVDKRMRKINSILKEDFEMPKLYGAEDAELTLICWGSHKGIALEAAKILNSEGMKVNVLHFVFLFPLDAKNLKKLFRKLNRTVMVENNRTSQLAGVLKEYAGFRPDFKLLKYDGRQFFPEEIASEVKKLKEKNWKGKKEIHVIDNLPYDYLQAGKVER
ncbi:MAG: 2-oxoacid:acceptor oxidoreductase subunit alpha [Candidatus ainarchaeum sp.]|nr:2-oxoacid:acceptor oxidoreductase subunit alpha [Candidatus ainarchaeum sp.]